MARVKTSDQKTFEHIPATWDYYCTLRNISREHLFKSMGISQAQYYHYRKHPEDIRLAHYDASCKCLNIPMEERRIYR